MSRGKKITQQDKRKLETRINTIIYFNKNQYAIQDTKLPQSNSILTDKYTNEFQKHRCYNP